MDKGGILGWVGRVGPDRLGRQGEVSSAGGTRYDQVGWVGQSRKGWNEAIQSGAVQGGVWWVMRGAGRFGWEWWVGKVGWCGLDEKVGQAEVLRTKGLGVLRWHRAWWGRQHMGHE